MKIFTIGFTQKSAEQFFGKLQHAGVKTVVDTRVSNTSQLSGFAKRDDLRFFLEAIDQIGYVHEPLLAPTQEMLSDYRKKRINWQEYELRFLSLLREREVEKIIDPEIVEDGCLLCSEAKPHHCHRRLVAEYLQEHWGNVKITHLV